MDKTQQENENIHQILPSFYHKCYDTEQSNTVVQPLENNILAKYKKLSSSF